MKYLLVILIAILVVGFIVIQAKKPAKKYQAAHRGEDLKDNINDISVIDMEGKSVNLSDYNGKVVLIVNVASKCGYTKQYKSLQEIYNKYSDKGFEILAFPCNQFGGQEPGTNDEIQEFCSINYGVTFRLFDKIDVNGENKSSLYEVLTNNLVTESGDVKWNFEKFLISKEGKIVARFRTKVDPNDEVLISALTEELNK